MWKEGEAISSHKEGRSAIFYFHARQTLGLVIPWMAAPACKPFHASMPSWSGTHLGHGT